MAEEGWRSRGKVLGDSPMLRSPMPEAQLQASIMYGLGPWRAMGEGVDPTNCQNPAVTQYLTLVGALEITQPLT